MPTARARLHTPAARRAAQRGQVLPIFALVVLILVMFTSLLIDGTFAFQTYRDLDTIAYHAARAGANEVQKPCTFAPGSNCTLAASAKTTAQKWAADWAAQDKITLVVNTATVTGDTITIHLRACYQFFIPIDPIAMLLPQPVTPLDPKTCGGGWQIDTVQSARSLVGP